MSRPDCFNFGKDIRSLFSSKSVGPQCQYDLLQNFSSTLCFDAKTSNRVFENIYWKQERAATFGKEFWKFGLAPRQRICMCHWRRRERITKFRYIFNSKSSQARKYATSQFIVQLLLLNLRYSKCLQTAWCQLQTLEVPQTNLKFSWSFL